MSSAFASHSSKDPTDPRLIPNLSARASCETPELQLCPEGRPLNPHGRTGLRGRGRLYKWGPNDAADPLVSRVSTASTSTSSPDLEPVLEIVVIRRGDTGAWALPGGMVDPGEAPRHTARREFGEEAMAHTDPAMRQRCERILDRVFGEGDGTTAAAEIQRVYAGYIDDPRNTDNAVSQLFWMLFCAACGRARPFAVASISAELCVTHSCVCDFLSCFPVAQWIESAVFHSHLDTPLAAALSSLLRAGDDANEVKWLRATADEPDMQNLYASHRPIVQLAVHKWKEAQKGKKGKE